ncbi:hypothetical protein GCM10010339_17450 [Streptomyces alanosinicus]|uniref:Uncharacterized protein n=2 Tax=Streptomyces alanosinicus TaxID=68171 RepID=A0A918YE30_9ACTN|nr:hypothetical protein GCM10010339_17450 [Streptomyces alanosinicus]
MRNRRPGKVRPTQRTYSKRSFMRRIAAVIVGAVALVALTASTASAQPQGLGDGAAKLVSDEFAGLATTVQDVSGLL